MSANTSISEGGKPRPFGPVVAIMVQGEDGKYYPWFPESDRALGTLSVDKNGIYRASDKGVYGWSRVSVNVPQNEGVTGKDPDTGEDVYVHPNPEGELVKDVLPVEIRVTTPPTKTIYTDGETIDYSGIVVHAYSATGQDMGEVPFGELVFTVDTAENDESKYQPAQATIDDTTILYNNPPISLPVLIGYGIVRRDRVFSNPTFWEETKVEVIESEDNVYGFCYKLTDYEGFAIILCSKQPFGYRVTKIWYNERSDPQYNESSATYRANSELIHGKTGRYHYRADPVMETERLNIGHYTTDGPYILIDTLSGKPHLIDDTIEVVLYGSITPGGIPIPVQWPRSQDGAVLETSFPITVTGGD